jgi:hypothetical protein
LPEVTIDVLPLDVCNGLSPTVSVWPSTLPLSASDTMSDVQLPSSVEDDRPIKSWPRVPVRVTVPIEGSVSTNVTLETTFCPDKLNESEITEPNVSAPPATDV